MSLVSELKAQAKKINIAEDLDKDELLKIGNRVLLGYHRDLASMEEWLADVKRVEELASLVAQKKNYPLPNSANIKFPLITKASYEFSSRTYPEIMKDGKVVKARVIGLHLDEEAAEKAERVADYMNYQLLFENNDWERDLDLLLTRLSLIGFLCKKSYWDPIEQKIKNEICEPEDLIIDAKVKSLHDARRISHVLHVYLNDLISGKNRGVYCEDVVDELVEEYCEDELDPKIDLVEQHTFLDLDDDDYSEPYIVTIVKQSGRILRIAPRFNAEEIEGKNDKIEIIKPIQLFTDYHFLVSPKGKFQSVGFGILMLHLNESINTILNMLIDAGQLANMQGGYKDSRLKNMGSGDSLHNPGEYKSLKAMGGVTLKDGLIPINHKEPSSVLYQLLGLLIQTGKDLSSSTEVMTGATQADNAKTGAVQALQAQGLKVFTSIQKRIYRSLSDDFRKIYTLNGMYLDPQVYYKIEKDKKSVKSTDFDLKSVDILPIADPNLSSEAQRSYRNQILIAAQQMPGTDKVKLTRLVLENSNIGVPVDDIMVPPEQLNKPDPSVIEIQAKIHNMGEQNALKGHELAIREKEVQIEAYKVQCQCIELKAKSMLEIAQAQAQKDNGKFKEYELQLQALEQMIGALQHAADFQQAGQVHQNEIGMKQQEINNNANQQENDNRISGESDNQTLT